MVGHRVVEFGDGYAVGAVESTGWYCLRVNAIPGASGRVVYVPTRAIEWVDATARAIVLAPGIGIEEMLAAPEPSAGNAGARHRSPEWWADLLAHYGYGVPGPGWTSDPAGVVAREAGDDRFRHARRAIAGLS